MPAKSKKKPVKNKIPADVVRRMKNRPYYAFLYAKNISGTRLPEKIEEAFVKDPHSAYLYAKHIIKGRLPDFVHTGLVIGTFDDSQAKEFVSKYLKEFC